MAALVEADPYPWPFDGALDPRRLALLIIGDQPGWVGQSVAAPAVRQVVDAVAGAVRGAGGLVVDVRTAWQGELEVSESSVCARGIDGFCGSSLDLQLRLHGADTLVFAGFGGEVTVSSTLRSANDRGYECLTLTDGVAMVDPGTGPSMLHSITMSGGIFGAIAPSAALLAALSPVEALL